MSKNFFVDGDFASAIGTQFDLDESSISAVWSSDSANGAGDGDTGRGTYSGQVYSDRSWAAVPYPKLPDSTLRAVAAVSLDWTDAAETTPNDAGAVLSATIPEGTRIFSGSHFDLDFWVYSTCRELAVRLVRNFGTGSSTSEEVVQELFFKLNPGEWNHINRSLFILQLRDQDLRPGDFLRVEVVIDNTTDAFASKRVRFAESSLDDDSALTAVTGFSLTLTNRSGVYPLGYFTEAPPSGHTGDVTVPEAFVMTFSDGLLQGVSLLST